MKRTRKKAVEECLRKGECVLPNCNKPMERRGLCGQHYGQYYYELRSKKSAEEKQLFEQKMIYEGLVLGAYAQRSRRGGNPFSEPEGRES